jgi:hypothetical protein
MRRGMWIVVVLLVILGAVGLGVGAYNAGLSEGVARAAEGGEAVRGVGHGYGFGFFPFGFLFPLLFFGLIFFAIATSLVEAHSGTISAQHRAGGGTTVRFTLPASAPDQALG